MGYWIVTGGASGIGLQLVRDLVARGHEVLVWDLKAPPAIDGVTSTIVDLSDNDAVTAAATAMSRDVDCFIHCAGVFASTSIHHDNLAAAMEITWRVHTLSFVLAVQGLLPRLKPGSSIIGITSAAQELVYPGVLGYGSSKAALAQAIKILSVELGERGVRVNGISPGSIETDMTAHLWADPDYARERLKHIPLGTRADTSVISEAIAYLVSDAARYTTGHVLWVDGGVRQGIFRDAVRAVVAQGSVD